MPEESSQGKLPLSLSVETQCGLASKIAEIGDSLPIRAARVFSTGSKIPDAVAVRLYAGERPFAKDNRLIGEVKLEGIQSLSVGRPVVSLILNVDSLCNISIEVTDEGSLKRDVIEVASSEWVPSADEVFKLVKSARDAASSESGRSGKVKLLQIARESLCMSEVKYRAIKKSLSSERRTKYKKQFKGLKSRLKKLNADTMSELDEKSVIAAINELNVTIGAEQDT